MMQKTVFIFPGQGTQFIGMGADLARDFSSAKEVFEEIDEALHQKLSALMFSGDLAQLTQTQNAQPAIMAVSMAVWRILQSEGVRLEGAVAGHSLGEYSALCAAGSLTLAETALLLKARGEAMAKACMKEEGGMLALLGVMPEQAKIIADKSKCYVANDNAPGQIVLSGNLKCLAKAKELAEQMGAKRVIPLKVAGAFHCPLMQSAADALKPILFDVHFVQPQMPIYFNVTATMDDNPARYADLLTQQITAPVRWRELIENTQGTSFVECGAGQVLSGLVRRIFPEAQVQNLGDSESVKNYLMNFDKKS